MSWNEYVTFSEIASGSPVDHVWVRSGDGPRVVGSIGRDLDVDRVVRHMAMDLEVDWRAVRGPRLHEDVPRADREAEGRNVRVECVVARVIRPEDEASVQIPDPAPSGVR